jgi:hypothetical protein
MRPIAYTRHAQAANERQALRRIATQRATVSDAAFEARFTRVVLGLAVLSWVLVAASFYFA